MANTKISFTARATGPEIILTVKLDGHTFYSGEPGPEFQQIECAFDDNIEKQHTLEIEMVGKIQDHTKIDDAGNITEDRVIEIRDITVDNIELGYMFTELASYQHDRNGTGPQVSERFYGEMGCNGVVKLEFTSPVYLWLLENM